VDWKEYIEKLMNEENEWDHGISTKVNEKPADYIRISEVVAALKKMKRQKLPCLSGLLRVRVRTSNLSAILSLQYP